MTDTQHNTQEKYVVSEFLNTVQIRTQADEVLVCVFSYASEEGYLRAVEHANRFVHSANNHAPLVEALEGVIRVESSPDRAEVAKAWRDAAKALANAKGATDE